MRRAVTLDDNGDMLSISGLSKRYGDIVATDGVSFDVPAGRLVGFVGPNGAGKSTTMRSIFGLVEPDAGSITWHGEPVERRHLAHFGYMPEQRGLYPKMAIAEQVAFFAELKGVDRRTARARAEELLDALGLGDRLDDPLEKLSHGNQQRVQLATSLANDPELLVLDEPFNGLDPVAVVTLQKVLNERVEAGAGVLFSSHQLDLVERLCDEIVIIIDGQIQASGTVRDVRAETGVRLVRLEVDRPIMPIADALVGLELVDSTTTTATVRVGSDAEIDDILGRARQAGAVSRLDYDMPTLEERFSALVTGNDPTAESTTSQSNTIEVLS